ncbi:MAG: FHA domain-containing protein [Desulfobacterales bacterium]|nr:FHA domain-containing protein [Desulfobacterales bacterium]
MGVLGLELSDAGILVAGGDPPNLLKLDGNGTESPGFALPEKKRLVVGIAAERKAHLYPRQVLNHFWDQLNTEPLEQPIPFAHNHAEIAFEHLAYIFQNVKRHGSEMIIAVPGFYTHNHLGLILGITKELAIPVKGFVPLAVAAVPDQLPPGLLLHLDLHLQRFEITHLQRNDQLSREESMSAGGSGLSTLCRSWVDAIAEEFVRHTRFDPLHQATTEQELYDRLPGVLAQLNQMPSVHFEMTGGSKVYHVTLTKELFLEVAAPVFDNIRRLIDRFCDRYGKHTPARVLLISDRLARLPNIRNVLCDSHHCKIVTLPPGSGALGALQFYDTLRHQRNDNSTPFLVTRPLPQEQIISVRTPRQQAETQQRPTHILYRDIAYPIGQKPLTIGLDAPQDGYGIQIHGQIAGVSRKHCSVQLSGNAIVIKDHSTYGTYVNEKPVAGKMNLELGQVIRVGTPGENLKLIACLDSVSDETQSRQRI